MRCPKCKGKTEYFKEVFNDGKRRREILVECDMCHGSGEVPMTNEEWLNNLNTEEKAKFLHDIQFSCNTCTVTSFRHYKSNIMQCPLNVACAKENGIEEWLKQPHTPFS